MSEGNQIRVFSGGVAIITGGASGIGRALGEALAARGCEVVLADIQIELAEEVAAGIRASGGRASAAKVDVTNCEDVAKVVQQTVDRCGRLDYMFNNAGIVVFGATNEYEMRDWDRSIDVNLRGVVYGVDAAYRVMLKQGFGHIVNTASIAGLIPWTMEIAYCATKHAVVGLSTTLRAEAAHAGVRVSVMCPGLVRTAILEGGKYGRWIRNYPKEEVLKLMESMKPLPVEQFVELALKDIARNKAIIVFPLMFKIFWWMYRVSPLLGIGLSRKLFHGMLQKLDKLEARSRR